MCPDKRVTRADRRAAVAEAVADRVHDRRGAEPVRPPAARQGRRRRRRVHHQDRPGVRRGADPGHAAAGQGQSLPTGVSGNVSDRFCLKVIGQVENDMILGTSRTRTGSGRPRLRPEIDAGIGYYVGGHAAAGGPHVLPRHAGDRAGRHPGPRSCARPRARSPASRSGWTRPRPRRDVLADLAAVFGADAGLQWGDAAARLAQRFPDRWAGVSAEAVSAEAGRTACRASTSRPPAPGQGLPPSPTSRRPLMAPDRPAG